ncbi:MAG: carbamoyl-phosphate synthase large subunit, partial [Burkholderiales bacterium]|nr:carbamoyl-phosphate synthase large subunit [Burkholderiales bacterium]
EEECEAEPTDRRKIMVLGGGPNRIGQGIEFDYCCCHASFALREMGIESIMVNSNPETVSTDYDTSDLLFFEPLTTEDVLNICDRVQPDGVIVQFGGQTPLNLARALSSAGVPIIGTSVDTIEDAEDREKFQQLLERLGLKQPANGIARTMAQARTEAAKIGFPALVRPSFVLGGRAMEICYDQTQLERFVAEAFIVAQGQPVLIDRFLEDAIEVDVDAISDGEQVVVAGIMEHIEEAGVHSGDSACSLPPFSLSPELQQELRRQTVAMAKALKVKGLMNVQFAIQHGPEGDVVYVLEVNPRASRTVPFVSKAAGLPLAKIAARCMAGRSLADQGVTREIVPPYYSVKEAVFPFIKFPGADTILGPEMKSTGEVMGVGETFAEAFVKSQLGSGERLPKSGKVFISLRDDDKLRVLDIARVLTGMGFTLVATHGTAKALEAAGLAVMRINKVAEGRPHIVDMIKNGEIVFIINTVEEKRSAIRDSYSIRRAALQQRVTLYTTLAGARAAANGMAQARELQVYAVQNLHKRLAA